MTGVMDRFFDRALALATSFIKLKELPMKEKKKQLSLLSADKAIAVTEQLKQ